MPRHHRNLQSFPTELYKIRHGLSPTFTKELFMQNNEHPYNLRHLYQFKMPSVNTVHRDIESVFFFLGPKDF